MDTHWFWIYKTVICSFYERSQKIFEKILLLILPKTEHKMPQSWVKKGSSLHFLFIFWKKWRHEKGLLRFCENWNYFSKTTNQLQLFERNVSFCNLDGSWFFNNMWFFFRVWEISSSMHLWSFELFSQFFLWKLQSH